MAGDSTDKGRATERTELDSTGEFFIVGAPLHAVRMGYIRRKADDELYEALAGGQYAHVLAPNNSGKSSLVAATAARLENNGVKVAVLDLEQIRLRDGGADPGRWYYNIAYRLLRQLRIRYDLQSWWQDKAILSNRQRLFEFYSEVILQHVPERIVVFVDEIQCIEEMPFAAELLVSIRAAHNARTTDPDFSRLTFALLGECDAGGLTQEAELSPFSVTREVRLYDFDREQLNVFATELDLDSERAAAALDRIYYWTRGQPYLVQKLSRAVAREGIEGDVAEAVDRIVARQLQGRAASRNEPHMNHIHRAIVDGGRRSEQLLNLYGRIRKGMEVAADLGSPLQRRLVALGLLEIDDDGVLKVRNRLYAGVFTTRWANEHLPIRLRVPAMVLAVLLLLTLIPLWYTQWLPRPYVHTLTATGTELDLAASAYRNLRSFPGHADTADDLFRRFLEQRAATAASEAEIAAVAELATDLPDAGSLPEALEAGFWQRQALASMAGERRDEALIATLRSLVSATPERRRRAARLIGEDYPALLATLPGPRSALTVIDPDSMVVTSLEGSLVSQWSYAQQALNRREDWTMTALEVTPLLRRVVVDREGRVNRIGLRLTISHARLADLRIKLIAPSGRTVEVKTGSGRSSSSDEIRIAPQQLRDFVGEPLSGTWTISVRDEIPGVAGQLVGWNLTLNAQGSVEDFQRGLNIQEPVERETDNVWIDARGRYAVARAMQSDSARIWDLALAEPLRAIAVTENETLIGLDAGARHLVTATQDRVNLWDTSSGDRVASIPIGAASGDVSMTADREHLFVERRSDVETRLEFWSLEKRALQSQVVVAGIPSLVAIDASGTRVAAADYDRSVRVWDMATGTLQGQVDLPTQPSAIALAPGGATLGVVFGNRGVSLWRIGQPMQRLYADFGRGPWQLSFSPSGGGALIGRPDVGFRRHATADGRIVGPLLGLRGGAPGRDVLSYSYDEQVIVTGARGDSLRFWNAPVLPAASGPDAASEHSAWRPGGNTIVAALPGAGLFAVGDMAGHVHITPAGMSAAEMYRLDEDVNFVGHTAPVRMLASSARGTFVASVAEDNSVRAWDTATGQPLPWRVDIGGDEVTHIAISADDSLLAILHDAGLRIVRIDSGETEASMPLDAGHAALAFAGNAALFVGSESGVLSRLERNGAGSWSMRRVWQGESAVRWLEASPRGQYLVLADARNVVRQFVLQDGRISDAVLELPSAVRSMSFGPGGGRLLLRTARWVHRASVSVGGLHWLDSVFIPGAVPGARIVAGLADDGQLAANRAFLPVLRGGYLELMELGFDASTGPGLFGNSRELLEEWHLRLFGVPPGDGT